MSILKAENTAMHFRQHQMDVMRRQYGCWLNMVQNMILNESKVSIRVPRSTLFFCRRSPDFQSRQEMQITTYAITSCRPLSQPLSTASRLANLQDRYVFAPRLSQVPEVRVHHRGIQIRLAGVFFLDSRNIVVFCFHSGSLVKRAKTPTRAFGLPSRKDENKKNQGKIKVYLYSKISGFWVITYVLWSLVLENQSSFNVEILRSPHLFSAPLILLYYGSYLQVPKIQCFYFPPCHFQNLSHRLVGGFFGAKMQNFRLAVVFCASLLFELSRPLNFAKPAQSSACQDLCPEPSIEINQLDFSSLEFKRKYTVGGQNSTPPL